MNKKITGTMLAAVMIAGTTSFSAFAAMGNGTVVIGNKAFNLTYANDPANAVEIGNAVLTGGSKVFVKGFDGKWINNTTGLVVDASVIPAVTYKSATGVVTNYNIGDMDVPVDTALKVASVSAINATQAKVVFSSPVAGGTLTNANDATKYSVGTSTNHPITAVLQADAKTVILTFADATTLTGTANAGVTDTAVIVEPIASAADALTLSPRYVTTLTYKDSVKPAIATITSSTNGTIASTTTVKFTEPVSSLGSVKIDGTGVVGNLSADKLSATFNMDLSSTTSHSIQFFGLTDIAGNVADLFTQTFTVTVDKVAPVATLAPSADVDHAFTLTFSKDVDPTTVVGNLGITAADEALGASFGTTTVSQPDLTNKKAYLVTGSGTIFGTKSTRSFTVVLPTTITDTLGNAFAATTANVTLTKDTVKPVITGTKVVKDAAGKVVSIQLSSSTTLANKSLVGLTIVGSNGVLVSGATAATTVATTTTLGTLTASISTDKKSVILTPSVVPASQTLLTGKYAFNFAAGTLSDEAQTANTSVAASQTVDFGTATTTGTFIMPAINYTTASNLQPTPTANVYTVQFGTAVKGGSVTGSATDPAHYTINGNALPAGTIITLNPALTDGLGVTSTDAASTIATITLPASTVAKTDLAAIFYIAGVQDASGNTVVPVSTNVKINDNIKPVMNAATLNTNGSVSVGFTETVNAVAAGTTEADFAVKLNGLQLVGANKAYTLANGAGSDAGKYVMTVNTRAVGIAASTGTVTGTNGKTYTGTASNVMKFVYVDVDGNTTFSSGDIVVSAVDQANTTSISDAAGVAYDLNKSATLTITSIDTPLTVTDTSNMLNLLTGSTTITVK